MRDKRTPKDVCGEATSVSSCCDTLQEVVAVSLYYYASVALLNKTKNSIAERRNKIFFF